MAETRLRATVCVWLKPEIPDVNGAALRTALRGAGYTDIESIRQGKLIEVEFIGDPDNAEPIVTKMCQQLLAHPFSDIYEFEIWRDGRCLYGKGAATEETDKTIDDRLATAWTNRFINN